MLNSGIRSDVLTASFDGRQIASGQPGPVFKELHAAYQALIASDRHGTPVFS